MPGTTPPNKHMRVYLTGAFRLEIRGEPVQLPTRKTRSLLAYLILHPGAHSREILAALYWGDSPDPAARSSLRRALTLLRKYIDDDLILADRETVQLNPSYPMWVDLRAFEQQAEGLLSGTTAQAEQFKSLPYEGDLLVDLYDEWILPLRTHYQGQYVDLLLRGVEQARGQSEYQLAIELAQKILKSDPANERAHQHLMFCYITLGERNKALDQYEACQRALQEELDVEPAQETQVLYGWIKQYEAEPTSLAARITNLPIPISSFVGRGRELSKIKGMVANTRLVTLTGPGGSGKTRLAIHAATDLIDQFKDGVWWVELAPVTEPELVPFAVAKALGVESGSNQPITETLKKYLYTRKALIILDNCEHLIEASAHLAESLLTCCVDLKVLATSREALCLVGESLYIVPPLTLPETETISLLDLLMEYEGVRLFIERAMAINPDFAPDEENATLITRICQRLDGIPLAIELAAARVRSLEVAKIFAGLDNTFQMLSATNRTDNLRHQSLQAAVDWSYDLLSEPERQLFCRLSIFTGGWTLEAAEAVCSGEGVDNAEITELLQRLVDKSLVNYSGNRQRYSMLETMRQYGTEKIIEAGKRKWIKECYIDYYFKQACIGDEKIRGPEQLTWFKWFDAEQDNITSAMKEAMTSEETFEQGCELVCSLCWYWDWIGGYDQMRYWLIETALPHSVALGDNPVRAKVLYSAGTYSVMSLGWLSFEDARNFVEESLEMWKKISPDCLSEQGKCFLTLGYIQKRFFNDDSGFEYLYKSISIFKEIQNTWWQAYALNILSSMLRNDPEKIQLIDPILKETETLWDELGDKLTSATTFEQYAFLASARGDYYEMQNHFTESLNIFNTLGAKGYVFEILTFLGHGARVLDQFEQAEMYYKEGLPLAEVTSLEIFLPRIYRGLGYVMLKKGEIHKAEDYFLKSLTLSREYKREQNRVFELVLCIAGYAALFLVKGEVKNAARYFGSYSEQLECIDPLFIKRHPISYNLFQIETDHYLPLCKAQMCEAEFEQAWIEGVSLSLEEVLSGILKEGY